MSAQHGTHTDQAIALVGIGCRYPGGVNGPDSFWRVLSEGIDVIGEIPAERWGPEYTSEKGTSPAPATAAGPAFLTGIDQFDAEFFGISAARGARRWTRSSGCCWRSPGRRWSDAGMPPTGLAGTRTGVYVGIIGSDYAAAARHDRRRAAHRRRTPPPAAAQLRRRPARLHPRPARPGWPSTPPAPPRWSRSTSPARRCGRGECRHRAGRRRQPACSPPETARASWHGAAPCRPTAAASPSTPTPTAIVRGEGCGVVVLKRLADAERDGDRDPRRDPRLSAVNQDGRSDGLTAPNGPAQEAPAPRGAARAAGLGPTHVGYVEAHGTGTPLGDPIEAAALGAGARPRSGRRTGRCCIGSVKTNFGHPDAAAGIAGLIKAVLAAQHRLVPPPVAPDQPQPGHRLGRRTAAHRRRGAATDRLHRRRPRGQMLLGVSAFGLCGTNAHVLLSAPPAEEPAAQTPQEPTPHVLLLSGSTEKALRERASDLSSPSTVPLPPPTSCTGRHPPYAPRLPRRRHRRRCRRTARFPAGVRRCEPDERTLLGTAEPRRRRRTVFVFSGQGSQWPGMGLDLWARTGRRRVPGTHATR